MPEIARFRGIVIRIQFNDHPPPHFHANYGDDEAVFEIHGLSLTLGSLPRRARDLVVDWASGHQTELAAAWARAERGEHPGRIG